MKKRNPTRAIFSAAKFVLALGTISMGAIIGWTIFSGFWLLPRILPTGFFGTFAYILLDGGVDKITDAARAINGQDRSVSKPLIILYLIIGFAGLGGSVAMSVLAINPIVQSTSGLEQKGQQAHKEIQQEQDKQDKRAAALIAEAEKDLQRATAVVAAAQSAYDEVEDKTLRQIGGQFEELWRKNNSWVRTARQFRAQRNRLEEAKVDAKKDLDDAKNNLRIAQKNKAEIVASANKAASSNAIVKRIETGFNKTVDTVQLASKMLKWTQPGAAILVLLCILILFFEKDVPDEKTLLEVIIHYYEFLSALSLTILEKPVDYLEKKTKINNSSNTFQQQKQQPYSQMSNPAYQNFNPQGGMNTTKIGFINYDDNKRETTAISSYPIVTDSVTLKEGVTDNVTLNKDVTLNVTHNNPVTLNKLSVTSNKLSVTDKPNSGVGVVRKCVVCGTGIDNKREDARTCSASCRQALKRRLKESAKKLYF